jgi:hypothetical protein
VTAKAKLGGVSAQNVDLTAKLTLDKMPSNYLQGQLNVRVYGTNLYSGRASIYASGVVQVELLKMVNGVQTSLGTATVSGLTYKAGETLWMRVQAIGSGTTTVNVRVWKNGSAEPGTWQLTRTDNSAGLQQAGGIEVGGYSSSTNSSTLLMTFDDIRGVKS